MTSLSSEQIFSLLQQLSSELSHKEVQEAALIEQIESLERELRDRKAILDRFAIVSETDTRGVITYANSKFCEVSGYSVEELVGKPHNIIRHPDMPKEAFKHLWDTIKAGKIWQGEVKNRRKDGSAYWVLATVGPLLDSEGFPYRYISMRIDITALKELEAQLQHEKSVLEKEYQENLLVASLFQKALLPPLQEGRISGFPLPHEIYLPEEGNQLLGTVVGFEVRSGFLVFLMLESLSKGPSGAILATLLLQEFRHLVRTSEIYSPERIAEALDKRLTAMIPSSFSSAAKLKAILVTLDLRRKRLAYLSLGVEGFWVRDEEIHKLKHFPFYLGEGMMNSAVESTLLLSPGERVLFSTGLPPVDSSISISQLLTTMRQNKHPFFWVESD
ncbi:MAG: PAS domain S-box protein [Bacteroidia bacterium]|nr:PAS domain S-box protein [Bacteroidia bacterium]